jgi:hypothetical protein
LFFTYEWLIPKEPISDIPRNNYMLILSASLRYRLLSETRVAVCPNYESVFVLWQEGAPEDSDQSTSLFWHDGDGNWEGASKLRHVIEMQTMGWRS